MEFRVKQYEDFKLTNALQYGARATSANFNNGPLLLKSELNGLYNYVKLRSNGTLLAWDDEETYSVDSYVEHNGVVYQSIVSNIDDMPPSSSWVVVVKSDFSNYTVAEINSLLALKYDAINVPSNPKFTDTIYDDTAINNKVDLKADIISSSTLSLTDALRISGNTISLYKGDGTAESIVIPTDPGSGTSTPLDQILATGLALSINNLTLTLNKGDGSSDSVQIPDIDVYEEVRIYFDEKADKLTTYTKTDVDDIVGDINNDINNIISSTYTKAEVDTIIDIERNILPNIKSAEHTLTLSDRHTGVDTSANIIIPLKATVNFPIGTVIYITNTSTSAITITPVTGVSLRCVGSLDQTVKTLSSYSSTTLRQAADNMWYISGNGVTGL